MSDPNDVGRVAVVTGASRGLGAELARAFAEAGLRLGLCARSAPVLSEADGVVAARCDVTDENGLVRFAARVEERFGAIDLWINNAGVLEPIRPLRDVDVAAFRRHVDVNLTGVFLGSRTYVRHRRAHGGGGVLVNVSSGAATKPYAGWSAYCAAKAGVERLTECLQLEEEATGLRAFSMAPGVIDTDMQEQIRASSPDDFPDVERFRARKREGRFNTGAFVAKHVLRIAFDPAARPEAVALRLPDEAASER